MKHPPEEIRKITVNLPAKLVENALANSEKNLSETIREALKDYNHRRACEALLQLRGKAEFLLSYEELKELRD